MILVNDFVKVQGKAEEFTVVNDEVLTQKFGKTSLKTPLQIPAAHSKTRCAAVFLP